MKRWIFSFLLVALGAASAVQAQVAIAPTVLVLSDRSPFATFVLINQSTTPQEVRQQKIYLALSKK